MNITNISRYNDFKSNESSVWKERFTWNGLWGDMPKSSISISKFAVSTGAFASMLLCKNVQDLHNEIKNNICPKYIDWIKSVGYIFSDKDKEEIDLENFFIGAMGEYFMSFMLNEIKCLLIPNDNGRVIRYDFSNIAPRLIGENDFGVDLTGTVQRNDKVYNAVFQVKFWNPFTDTPITNKIVQSVHSDAIINDFINQDDLHNIFICWLGNTNNVSKYLKQNSKLYEHVVFIDMKVLNDNINNKLPDFWNKLKVHFENIILYK